MHVGIGKRRKAGIRVCVFAIISDKVPYAQMLLVAFNVKVVKNE